MNKNIITLLGCLIFAVACTNPSCPVVGHPSDDGGMELVLETHYVIPAGSQLTTLAAATVQCTNLPGHYSSKLANFDPDKAADEIDACESQLLALDKDWWPCLMFNADETGFMDMRIDTRVETYGPYTETIDPVTDHYLYVPLCEVQDVVE